MKIGHVFKLTLFLTVALNATSCEDEIDIDLDEGPKRVVVEGFLSQRDTMHEVRLTLTQGYYDDTPPDGVTGAAVEVLGSDGSVRVFEPAPDSPGVYRYQGGGNIGVAYTLRAVLTDGRQIVSAPEILNAINPISAIYFEEEDDELLSQEDRDEGKIYKVLINTEDPDEPNQFYRWKAYLNGEFQNRPFDIAVASDELVNGNPIIGVEVTSQTYAAGDTLLIEQIRISRPYYDFMNEVLQQTGFVGSTFDPPPAPIAGNLSYTEGSDEVLGYFWAGGITDAALIIDP